MIDAVPDDVRAAFALALDDLIAAFEKDGDADAFAAGYLWRVRGLSNPATQAPLVPGLAARPATAGGFHVPEHRPLLRLLDRHVQYAEVVRARFDASIAAHRAYDRWCQRVRGIFKDPEREFCLQTTYLHFVRLFFVRVCEDFGLVERRISNGPFKDFEEYRQRLLQGVRDVYPRLLAEAYDRAGSVYHNFFARQDLYDWFVPDEPSVLGVLAVLNRYDVSAFDFDLLGKLYNEGYIEELDRSERGQFYTPPTVVRYMVDALGVPTREALEAGLAGAAAEVALLQATALDPACGSGSFLVEIAARKALVLRARLERGEIGAADAVEAIAGTLVGVDINPFACYLAEINLLIRCMPFLARAQRDGGAPPAALRLLVFCADGLEPTQLEQVEGLLGRRGVPVLIQPRGEDIAQARDRRSPEERLIARFREHRAPPTRLGRGPGFTYVIGNPPYVRADESAAHLRYRERVRGWGVYTLQGRWDLFVPFVERGLHFLASGGTLAMITSDGLETEGYAEPVRERLLQRHLTRIDFFPGVFLFRDAAVHNTIITVVDAGPDGTPVRQRIHRDASGVNFEEREQPRDAGPERIFRHRYRVPEQGLERDVVALCALAYLGTGLEAHSREGHAPRFALDDSFRHTLDGLDPVQVAAFADRGVVGEQVVAYGLRGLRFVAYDRDKGSMRRPRLESLFRTPEKLLLGETSGGYHDTAGLFANHSVQVLVPWHALTLIERGMVKVHRETQRLSGLDDLAAVSRLFDLRYVLAILNSALMREHLHANRVKGTRPERIYPDVWKSAPIKIASPQVQAAIATKVDTAQDLLRRWREAPQAAVVLDRWCREGRLMGKLRDYVLWGVVTLEGSAARPCGPTGEQALRAFGLARAALAPELASRPPAEAADRLLLPPSIEEIALLCDQVDAAEAARARLRAEADASIVEIEEAVRAVYTAPGDPSLLATVDALRAVQQTVLRPGDVQEGDPGADI